MSFVESLLDYLKRNKKPVEDDAPDGLCPNCWGRQEYGGKFYEAVKNHGLDVNTKDTNVGWVKEYAEKHLQGIRLRQDDDKIACPSCKITYKPN